MNTDSICKWLTYVIDKSCSYIRLHIDNEVRRDDSDIRVTIWL